MNISHIHYAVEVAHYGSFNKAAANLFVSQPSLSRAIKELERELGFDLFLRTPNGVVPTHQGKEFLHRAKHLDNQYMALWDQYVVSSQAVQPVQGQRISESVRLRRAGGEDH